MDLRKQSKNASKVPFFFRILMDLKVGRCKMRNLCVQSTPIDLHGISVWIWTWAKSPHLRGLMLSDTQELLYTISYASSPMSVDQGAHCAGIYFWNDQLYEIYPLRQDKGNSPLWRRGVAAPPLAAESRCAHSAEMEQCHNSISSLCPGPPKEIVSGHANYYGWDQACSGHHMLASARKLHHRRSVV